MRILIIKFQTSYEKNNKIVRTQNKAFNKLAKLNLIVKI